MPHQVTYTGHPFIDIGFATMTAFVKKRQFADLTADDFHKVADDIETNYVRQPLRSFLTVAFTSNAWFAQSAFNPDRFDSLTRRPKRSRNASIGRIDTCASGRRMLRRAKPASSPVSRQQRWSCRANCNRVGLGGRKCRSYREMTRSIFRQR